MYLRYIGKNKSMGLISGKIYKVDIYSKNNYIWVQWGLYNICPYESPESLAKNWTI